MQVVALIECSGAGHRVWVEVNCRSGDANISWRLTVKFQPGSSACWNELVKTRRDAWQVVGQAGTKLAATGNRKTQRVFGVVVKNSEQRSQRVCSCSQVATNSVYYQHRVVAVRPAANI